MAGQRKSGGLRMFWIGSLLLLILFLFPKKANARTTILTILQQKLDAKNANFWVAIAAHETNGFSSEAFVKGNNAFGMRWVTCGGRIGDPRSLAIGAFSSGERVDIFSSVEDSAKDLLLYFQRTGWTKLNYDTIDDLVNAMKAKDYFTDSVSNYLTDVKRWLNKV